MLIPIFTKILRHLVFGHSSTMMFFKGLNPAIKKAFANQATQIIYDIKAKASLLINENQTLVIDASSRGHVEFSSHILASYLILLPEFSNDQQKTTSFISEAIMNGYDTWMLRLIFQTMFRFYKSKPEKICDIFSWMMKQYGASFSWKMPQSSDQPQHHNILLTVNTCFYFEFFKSYNATFLTPILCQLDAIWFKLLDPKKHGLVFNKTHYQTQGYGAVTCEFPIDKVKTKIRS